MPRTKSLCPECLKVINADIVKRRGKILIEKECMDHGKFSDVYWSDADLYERFRLLMKDGEGIQNPMTKTTQGCPFDCGLCDKHHTSTVLANLDITNRCNQKCPICFANAAVAGYIYEPTLEEIKKMLTVLRNEKPVPAIAVQFSGGEPTLREDFVEIIKMAREMGFIHVQVASNGVKFAQQKEFIGKLKDAGLSTIYLQFDGLKAENYIKIRGYNALPNKLKVITNARRSDFGSVVLVPTVVKGENDDQVGPILKFALNNIDVVRAVNFQPVSFVGRIDQEQLRKMRITIPDVIKRIKEQTDGKITERDFYPIPFETIFSRFISAWQEQPSIKLTIHPHCGAATYIFYENDRIIPVTSFIDADRFAKLINSMVKELERSKSKQITKIKLLGQLLHELPRIIDRNKAPKSLDIIKSIIRILREGTYEALAELHNHTLFVGIMHFQDAYNFDLERVKRCGIHYVVPDGRVIPFCSYNAIYRTNIEKKFSRKFN